MIVIPIGTFCQLCGTIERLKYRYMALPFDYIRSNILMINDCINNNFATSGLYLQNLSTCYGGFPGGSAGNKSFDDS